MDIIHSESNLMRSFYPTDILGFLISGGVRGSGDVPSLSADAEPSRDAETQNLVRRGFCNARYSDGRRVDLRRWLSPLVCRPEHCRTESTDHVGTDQIGVPQGKRLSLPIIDNGVCGVSAVRCRTAGQQVARD